MRPLRALLVEDEAPARRRLARLLAAHRSDVEVVGEAADVGEAVEAAARLHPDLLFLDVQLPGQDGFALLRVLVPRPQVVFVTAYASYAVQAFEESAVDYLLKPVEPERLEAALRRVRERTQPSLPEAALERLARALRPPAVATSIPVRLGDRFLFIPLHEVTHFEAEDKYVTVHTVEGKAYLTDHPLVGLAPKLPPSFLQVHRSVIVNRDHVRELQPFLGGRFVLTLGGLHPARVITGPTYAAAIRRVLTF